MKKTLLMAGVGTAVGLAAFAGVASAQTPDASGDSLVDKIATRFNLNKNEVQQVFDEEHEAHEAEMEKKVEERLTQAVEDGKITADQKQSILDKQKEMKTYMDSLKDKTEDERRELMKDKMDELKQWAEDNNLTDYVMMGHMGHGPRMEKPDDIATDTTE